MANASQTQNLLARFNRPSPRYTSYPTALDFDESFDAVEYGTHLGRLGTGDSFGAYVHVPFCEKRCAYCAYNVIRTPLHDRVIDPYVAHLEKEIALVSAKLSGRPTLSRLHFGGGTPTYLEPAQLARVVETLQYAFTLKDGAELSMEIDPRVTSMAHLATCASLGFGRLSLGVQDFDPAVQEAIGRIQSFAETSDAISTARKLGIQRINVDLVYGLPGQTPESLNATLDQVLRLNPDRLAIYSFAYLPQSQKHQADSVPSASARVNLLQVVRERLGDAGYVDIGIDHFALPEDPLAIAQRPGVLRRDFLGYTPRQEVDYVGFGASAIGCVGGAYAQNSKKLSRYYAALDANTLPTARGLKLAARDRMTAHVIGEIMCNFTVDKSGFERTFGRPFNQNFELARGRLAPLIAQGFVDDNEDAIHVSDRGRVVARNVAMCFDEYLSEEKLSRFSSTV
ncbi:MAG: oxygen-independent coproporphyrinogen-3 oxidase [Bradymonadia bacterium]|jgi:oxygen-independent coproporphyrinogen-3 oxidase